MFFIVFKLTAAVNSTTAAEQLERTMRRVDVRGTGADLDPDSYYFFIIIIFVKMTNQRSSLWGKQSAVEASKAQATFWALYREESLFTGFDVQGKFR